MEAVARQFVPDGQKAMVLRNGWFSYRWTEILDMAFPGNTHTVLKAVPSPIAGSTAAGEGLTHFRPAPVKDVVAKIREERPKAFFCPHVETSTGMMLPDEYVSIVHTHFRNVIHSDGSNFQTHILFIPLDQRDCFGCSRCGWYHGVGLYCQRNRLVRYET